MKTDIQTVGDIRLFVDSFYQQIQNDDRLGPIFANVDWPQHLETMRQFWETVILGATPYQGNPLTVHLAINKKIQNQNHSSAGIQPDDFARWLVMFEQTLDEKFSGPNTAFAKQSAGRMAEHLSKVCSKGYRPSDLNRVPYRPSRIPTGHAIKISASQNRENDK